MDKADRERSELDVSALREDFPILGMRVGKHPLIYLDNAASAQKPKTVIESQVEFYSALNANVHRGVHFLSQQASDAYENSRATIARFLNAPDTREIIYVKGTTEAINLVAQSFGGSNLEAGDEVVISGMEHHANIVPWQLICEKVGAKLVVIPVSDAGVLDLDAYRKLLGSGRAKIVSIVHISNALGTINPVKEMIGMAKAAGVPVLVDAAQSAPHLPVDVQELDCDFLTFSGHKLFGPTGIGVLYGKQKWLNAMPPYQGGGDMIDTVSFEKTTFREIPERFEAGTPNIAGVIGLGRAIEYIESVGREKIYNYEKQLTDYAAAALKTVDGLRFVGDARNRAAVFSFLIDKTHPHDIGTFLDNEGIAIRAGHHCAQPLMERFKIPGTARASFCFYNTVEEVDRLVVALNRIAKFFS